MFIIMVFLSYINSVWAIFGSMILGCRSFSAVNTSALVHHLYIKYSVIFNTFYYILGNSFSIFSPEELFDFVSTLKYQIIKCERCKSVCSIAIYLVSVRLFILYYCLLLLLTHCWYHTNLRVYKKQWILFQSNAVSFTSKGCNHWSTYAMI